MSTFSRRLILFAGAGSGALAVTAGVVNHFNGGSSDSKVPPGVARVDPQDAGLRARALRDEQALAKQAAAVIALLQSATGPDATARTVVAALQTHHNDHTKFLQSAANALPRAVPAALLGSATRAPLRDPAVSLEPSPIVSPAPSPVTSPSATATATKPSPKPSSKPTPKPSASQSPSPPPRRLPPPSPSPTLSSGAKEALTELIRAERSAEQRRRSDCLGAGAELARILASMAASGAVHSELLGSLA